MAQGGGQDRLPYAALAVEATGHRSPDEAHVGARPHPRLQGGEVGGARLVVNGQRGDAKERADRPGHELAREARAPRGGGALGVAGGEPGGHLLDGLVDSHEPAVPLGGPHGPQRPLRRKRPLDRGDRLDPLPRAMADRHAHQRHPTLDQAGQLDTHDEVGGQEVRADQQDRQLGAHEVRLDLVVPPPGHADAAIRPQVHLAFVNERLQHHHQPLEQVDVLMGVAEEDDPCLPG